MMLRKGRPPWAPTADASDVDEIVYYNHPLIGTYVSSGETWLFDCLIGQDSRLSLWSYTKLGSDELDALEDDALADPKAAADWALRVSRRRAKYVVLAWEDRVRMHADVDGDVLQGMGLLLKGFEQETEEMKARNDEWRQRMEAVTVVEERRQELVNA